MNRKIGKLDEQVIDLLGLPYRKDMPIYISDANMEHIRRKHLQDYIRYSSKIEDIIKAPTYVAKNPKQNSIEYIKEYKLNNNLVLVAVRASNNGQLFVRTLFTMTERKKEIYLEKGYAKKYQHNA